MEMSSSINGEVHEDKYSDCYIDIKEEFEHDRKQCCIYRVPKSIRKGKDEAYTPQIVSIGPFHYREKKLEVMEKRKEIYVTEFFKRTTCEKREEVLAFIKDNEQQIRKCYSERCKLDSHDYVIMIQRDAIFIIELLVRNYEKHERDLLLNVPAEKYALRLDLQLLENQLPYFLLDELYKLVVGSPPFIDICVKFFRLKMVGRKEFKHFTDWGRDNKVGNFQAQKYDREDFDDFIPCATKLHESGVKFTCSGEKGSKIVIKFEEGELRIPPLSVRHDTDTIYRNIMALEQCYYPFNTAFCDYVLLLDSLIEDKRDAQLLVDKGIICNYMGDSKALASLFNKISVEIPLYGYNYGKIYEGLREYHDNEYNQNKAKLKRVYFSDVWRGTATVAAAALLILTFIQTISSVTR